MGCCFMLLRYGCHKMFLVSCFLFFLSWSGELLCLMVPRCPFLRSCLSDFPSKPQLTAVYHFFVRYPVLLLRPYSWCLLCDQYSPSTCVTLAAFFSVHYTQGGGFLRLRTNFFQVLQISSSLPPTSVSWPPLETLVSPQCPHL